MKTHKRFTKGFRLAIFNAHNPSTKIQLRLINKLFRTEIKPILKA